MQNELPTWAPDDIDPAVPSVARVYDYVLGGGHHFESDRLFAQRLSETWPVVLSNMRENRSFLRRAVCFLADQGIDQFLDIGSGIPTAGNVHEVLAAAGHTEARVAYVDRDPVAVLHSQAILAGNPTTTAVHGDFTDIDTILTHPQVTGLLDLDRPIGVLLVAMLHAVGDADDPWSTVTRLRERTAPGSYFAMTHGANEATEDAVQGTQELSRQTPTPWTPRSKDQIARFFDGLDVVEPGLVYIPLWRPESPSDVGEDPEATTMYAGVGIRH